MIETALTLASLVLLTVLTLAAIPVIISISLALAQKIAPQPRKTVQSEYDRD